MGISLGLVSQGIMARDGPANSYGNLIKIGPANLSVMLPEAIQLVLGPKVSGTQ
jgi:hypothetical protein